jgi:hypothetical protein
MPRLVSLVILALSLGAAVQASDVPASSSSPKSFKVSIADSEIERTKALLNSQRLPSKVIVPGADFSYGAE